MLLESRKFKKIIFVLKNRRLIRIYSKETISNFLYNLNYQAVLTLILKNPYLQIYGDAPFLFVNKCWKSLTPWSIGALLHEIRHLKQCLQVCICKEANPKQAITLNEKNRRP